MGTPSNCIGLKGENLKYLPQVSKILLEFGSNTAILTLGTGGYMASKHEEVDFSHLIFGFSSAALSYMGIQIAPDMPQPGKNLALAKQNIDIIVMLKEKTKGNLTRDEESLVTEIISDLKVKYVEASR